MMSQVDIFKMSGIKIEKTSFDKKKKLVFVVNEKPPNLVRN